MPSGSCYLSRSPPPGLFRLGSLVCRYDLTPGLTEGPQNCPPRADQGIPYATDIVSRGYVVDRLYIGTVQGLIRPPSFHGVLDLSR